MSENISDQTFTSVVAGEEEGYVVFAQYGATALTVDLEEVLNDLAARLRSVDERLALTNKRYESVCNRVVILEATTARQERETEALRKLAEAAEQCYRSAFRAGFDASGEGWNGEWCNDPDFESDFEKKFQEWKAKGE